jgi:hypothetical protein
MEHFTKQILFTGFPRIITHFRGQNARLLTGLRIIRELSYLPNVVFFLSKYETKSTPRRGVQHFYMAVFPLRGGDTYPNASVKNFVKATSSNRKKCNKIR